MSKEEVEDFMSQADVVSSSLASFVLSSELGLGLGVIVFIDQTELPAPCLVFWLFCNFPLITPVTVTLSQCHMSQHRLTSPHLSPERGGVLIK